MIKAGRRSIREVFVMQWFEWQNTELTKQPASDISRGMPKASILQRDTSAYVETESQQSKRARNWYLLIENLQIAMEGFMSDWSVNHYFLNFHLRVLYWHWQDLEIITGDEVLTMTSSVSALAAKHRFQIDDTLGEGKKKIRNMKDSYQRINML